MFWPHAGTLRPVLAIVLAVLGVLLRFTIASPLRGFGLRRFGRRRDDDLHHRLRHNLGELLLLWSLWLVIQMASGMHESWFTAFWVPLVIVLSITAATASRRFGNRYLSGNFGGDPRNERVIPEWGGWPVVILREVLPLSALLLSILVVRTYYGALPDLVPVGWRWGSTELDTRWRDEALVLLRHRTSIVYLLLSALEGGYLIWSWGRGRRSDIARRMLTPPHWAYFFFKLGWVLLFAGLNVGFVRSTIQGPSPAWYGVPGLFALLVLGALLAMRGRRGEPPAADAG